MKENKKTITVISAHSDDAAYSISIMLNKYSSNYTINLIVVFTLTDYAPNLSEKDIKKISQIRKKETQIFAESLNANIFWLDIDDACLRPDYVDKDVCHKQNLTKRDKELIIEIHNKIVCFKSDLYLFPLAIGNHIDHRIIKDLGINMANDGYIIGFYEDLPYAFEYSQHQLSKQIALINQKLPYNLKSIPISMNNYEQLKTNYANLNSSQICVRYIQEILSYCRRILQDNNCIERLWLRVDEINMLQKEQEEISYEFELA
jgi:LmbE family N-acetylglucosaminyl deacetylase